ncbi:hypothetical protein RE6C_04055 [Rhodopirellula europaea 6C]|uniref:Uncharacterized protein n=1 Tax=Rhodopirellula europaea 6C TaxID=1263867 RepID=M2ADM4_9BACT|nr:hypothetical protein RE6C_04055 [Rhodopirellula europaea 6C]
MDQKQSNDREPTDKSICQVDPAIRLLRFILAVAGFVANPTDDVSARVRMAKTMIEILLTRRAEAT